MSATNITSVKLERNTIGAMPTTVAVDSSDKQALVDFTSSDDKILILIENANSSAAKDVTILAGDGIQGVDDYTQTVSIPSSTTKCVVLESGKYKITKGTNKGKVLITGDSTDIKIGAIVLP